jgi:tetratricopeptide (TPR) repeat protein
VTRRVARVRRLAAVVRRSTAVTRRLPAVNFAHASARVVLALVIACVAANCAKPKRAVLPPAVTTLRYPEFVYPVAPPKLGLPRAAAAHQVAWQWLQSGDLRTAERSFSDVLKTAPEFYPAEAGLGFVALAKKDYRAASSHFDRALASDPGYAPALAGRGEALLTLGQRQQALASFEAAVAADPNLTELRARIDVLRLRGMQDDVDAARKAAEAGRLDEAQAIYERTLAESPDSPFLYRELAIIERRNGNLDAALGHARKAAELSPSEPRNFVALGEIYEAQADFTRAAEAYRTANSLEPSDTLQAKLDELTEKAAFAAMPEEYRAIETAPTVTRAQLAALLGVRLDDVLKRARRDNPVVLTDTRGNWAGPWIQAVSRAGIMEAYANHTFQPNEAVRRADLALAASRVLSFIATERPRQAAAWKDPHVRFSDLPPGHLSYPAAAVAVQAGVMKTVERDEFQLSGAVTGAEALAAVKKLEALSGRKPR